MESGGAAMRNTLIAFVYLTEGQNIHEQANKLFAINLLLWIDIYFNSNNEWCRIKIPIKVTLLTVLLSLKTWVHSQVSWISFIGAISFQ